MAKFLYKDIKEYIEVETNSGCILLSNTYEGTDRKLNFRCKCGNEFTTTYSHFKRNNVRQCKHCGWENGKGYSRKTLEQFCKEVYELEGDGYRVIGKYANTDTNILMRHEKCNCEFDITPACFLRGERCPQCAWISRKRKMTRTHESFILQIEEKFNGEYTVLGKYKTARIKISMIHNKCGYIWDVAPDALINNTRGCPKCASSKGETIISEWLNDNGVKYISQYRLKDCKNKRPLPFDFYLPNQNLCIEYDGEFHYKETGLGNNLKLQQKHDKIKNDYCIKNNIPLMRIPYWEFNNIENILKSHIKTVALT